MARKNTDKSLSEDRDVLMTARIPNRMLGNPNFIENVLIPVLCLIFRSNPILVSGSSERAERN